MLSTYTQYCVEYIHTVVEQRGAACMHALSGTTCAVYSYSTGCGRPRNILNMHCVHSIVRTHQGRTSCFSQTSSGCCVYMYSYRFGGLVELSYFNFHLFVVSPSIMPCPDARHGTTYREDKHNKTAATTSHSHTCKSIVRVQAHLNACPLAAPCVSATHKPLLG